MVARIGAVGTLRCLAGVGLVGYGILFLIRNFVGFTELGLSPRHVGGTPHVRGSRSLASPPVW